MARRTKAEAEATREAILLAAEAEFLARGVGGTSLEQIAQRAGVTRGAVYWHFKNKLDLFHAVMEQVRMPLDRISGRLAEGETAGETEPVQRLRDAVHRILHLLRDDERYRRIYTIWLHRLEANSEYAQALDHDGSRTDEVLAAFTSVFAAAARDGRLQPGVVPARAAQAVRLLLVGLITDWLRDMQQFDIVEEGGAIFETLMAGLVRPGV